MERGQISNERASRFIITWDVLASLPEDDVRAEKRARKLHRWEKAVDLWVLDRQVVGRMYLIENRYAVRWELACFDVPREFCDAVAERLDAENVGVAQVQSFVSPLALAESLAYRQDVQAVVDTPARGLYYGSKTLDPRSI